MNKRTTTIAAIAFVAMTGLFAQSNKGKNLDAKKTQDSKEPPKIELPSAEDLKAYHEAELQSLKILLDAQVKAKMISQEWADAKIAILKAVQADCKGHCIVWKTTDIPFGNPFFQGPRHMGFYGQKHRGMAGHHFNGKRRGGYGRPNFDRDDMDRPDFDEIRERHQKWQEEEPLQE
ncbi:MAG: hypothetical protein K6A42_03615 [Treponema sp.]|nr:hypothetical protein [Treponema sp.]